MTRGLRTPLSNYSGRPENRWQSGEFLECVGTHDELANVRSYFFRDPDCGIFHFKPGQHITLSLPMGDVDEFRTFTIASAPTTNSTIQIIVKTSRPNGATNWMRENIKPGTRLQAYGPAGRFSVLDKPTRKLMLLSAGSGITPMLSMLRWLHDRNESTSIIYLHYAKSTEHFMFRDELAHLERALPDLTVQQIPSTASQGAQQDRSIGRISKEHFATFGPLEGYTVFCCGPNGFMNRAREILVAESDGVDQFLTESFATQIDEAIVIADPASGVRKSTLSVTLDDREVDGYAGEMLLSTLRRAKVVIPTGCKEGRCGTCRLRLVDGRVNMIHKGGLSQKEEMRDVILACCSTVQSDITLRRC